VSQPPEQPWNLQCRVENRRVQATSDDGWQMRSERHGQRDQPDADERVVDRLPLNARTGKIDRRAVEAETIGSVSR
jgi:hypothetical protein